MLDVSNLSLAYDKIRALQDVSLRVDDGQHVAVLGPNGAGKSTLIRAIAGMKIASSGTITFDGKDITDLPPWERVRMGIGVIPEGGRVFPDASVIDNLRVGGYIVLDSNRFNDRLADVYELFPILEERANQRAKTLSGGEQQMLAIGRAMMTDPKMILVDEITMGLMPQLVKRAYEVLSDLNDQDIAILQVEQNVKRTLEVADYAYVLENGRIGNEGSAHELENTTEIQESYLGG